METIEDRTRKFAVRAIKFANSLSRNTACYVIARQLIKSATSVGANYRSALRARSRTEFIAKLGIVGEEADETVYWLEILKESDLATPEKIGDLLKEAEEITAIIIASIKTAKQNKVRSMKYEV